MIVNGVQCSCAVCAKPRMSRTWPESVARYKRLRELEAQVLCRRAEAVQGVLEARTGLSPLRFTPQALRATMAQGFSYWPRWYWRIVPQGAA